STSPPSPRSRCGSSAARRQRRRSRMALVATRSPRATRRRPPRPPRSQRPGPVTNANVSRVLGILRREHDGWNAPVVTFISTSTGDPYRTLTSCILSLRTRDEVTAKASERLFALADSPAKLAATPEDVLAKAIYPVGF